MSSEEIDAKEYKNVNTYAESFLADINLNDEIQDPNIIKRMYFIDYANLLCAGSESDKCDFKAHPVGTAAWTNNIFKHVDEIITEILDKDNVKELFSGDKNLLFSFNFFTKKTNMPTLQNYIYQAPSDHTNPLPELINKSFNFNPDISSFSDILKQNILKGKIKIHVSFTYCGNYSNSYERILTSGFEESLQLIKLDSSKFSKVPKIPKEPDTLKSNYCKWEDSIQAISGEQEIPSHVPLKKDVWEFLKNHLGYIHLDAKTAIGGIEGLELKNQLTRVHTLAHSMTTYDDACLLKAYACIKNYVINNSNINIELKIVSNDKYKIERNGIFGYKLDYNFSEFEFFFKESSYENFNDLYIFLKKNKELFESDKQSYYNNIDFVNQLYEKLSKCRVLPFVERRVNYFYELNKALTNNVRIKVSQRPRLGIIESSYVNYIGAKILGVEGGDEFIKFSDYEKDKFWNKF